MTPEEHAILVDIQNRLNSARLSKIDTTASAAGNILTAVSEIRPSVQAIVARQVSDADLTAALNSLVPTLTTSVASAVGGGTTDPAAIAHAVVSEIADVLKGASA